MNIAKIIGSFLVVLPLIAFTFFGTTEGSLFGNVALAGYGKEKVTMCRPATDRRPKEKTVLVRPKKVEQRLAQGYTLGPCSSSGGPGDPPEDDDAPPEDGPDAPPRDDRDNPGPDNPPRDNPSDSVDAVDEGQDR